eukprot:scaffold1560_cov177-Ochromonas_danica.AAC.7
MQKKKGSSRATQFFIYALGIGVMCGRQCFKWHVGFGKYGLYMYGLVVLIYVLAFTALTYSFAELVSIVPFSGGCYGYSRCALGPMMGYMAGMFETAKYILYASFNMYRLGDIMYEVYGFDEKYQIVVWLAFLVAFNLVHYFQTKLLWWIIALVGTSVFVVQVIFIFGATSEGSVANLSASRWDNEPISFVETLPYAVYMLSALDAVRTCVDDQQGSDIVPRALVHILAWSTLAGFASIVAQAAYVYDDSALAKEQYAYNVGLRMVFNMRDGNKFVTLFAFPGSLACCLGFLYCASRQVRSMASSGLLPPFLAMGQGQKVKDSSQPVGQATSVVPTGGVVRESSGRKGDEDNNNDLAHGRKPTMAVFATSKRQFFSKEEQEKFMKAYVVNANKTRKRGKSGSNNKQSSQSSGVMSFLAGAVGFIQNNASRGASSRSRASSLSAQNKGGASSNASVAHNAVAPV